MNELSPDDVAKIAKLSRLSLTAEQAEAARVGLGAVLGHVTCLDELDLDGVEPMAGPNDESNRVRNDDTAEPFGAEAVAKLAPDSIEHDDGVSIHVPKVLGDGGGA